MTSRQGWSITGATGKEDLPRNTHGGGITEYRSLGLFIGTDVFPLFCMRETNDRASKLISGNVYDAFGKRLGSVIRRS